MRISFIEMVLILFGIIAALCFGFALIAELSL